MGKVPVSPHKIQQHVPPTPFRKLTDQGDQDSPCLVRPKESGRADQAGEESVLAHSDMDRRQRGAEGEGKGGWRFFYDPWR